jgi:hypothetical protein
MVVIVAVVNKINDVGLSMTATRNLVPTTPYLHQSAASDTTESIAPASVPESSFRETKTNGRRLSASESQSRSQQQDIQSHHRQSKRRLPVDMQLDPAQSGVVLVAAVVLLLLLCCCRGMLCDILACVCLYEMCCDDGAVGGFNLMPV